MSAFTKSISQIFEGAVKSVKTFPAAIASALAFAIVTMVRIQLDWPEQEAYNFLFNCLHLSFALGAIFSLTAITAAQSRYNDAKSFMIANLMGIVVVVATFLMLYFFGGTDPSVDASRYARVTVLAATRVSAAMLVSFLAFIVLAGYPKEQSDFSRSFFMTHKAFFIAMIYGGVIEAGGAGVAGAVQGLLYRDMSGKVYMYIATIAGFLAYAIFIGYFPDFRKGAVDEKREVAQKQPRFIEILFEYIMIPIAMALTVVLLLWSGKTIVTGEVVPFIRLSAIATSYAVIGTWLHIMVTHSEAGIAKFYRKIYPFTALVILAFEARSLLMQLGKSGLKTAEYSFILIWIIAVTAAILLIFRKAKAHKPIIVLACALAVFSVLPLVGYHALPVASQVSRLENILVSQNMLEGGKLIPAKSEPEKTVKEAITDAVVFLAYAPDAKLPVWFDKSLGQSDVFKERLGFEQTYPEPDYEPGGGYLGTHLSLPAEAIDISEYRWAVNMQGEKETAAVTIQGEKGTYRIEWRVDSQTRIPTINIRLGERVIIEQNLNAYIDRITEKYPPGKSESRKATFEDMSYRLETPEVTVLLVFNNVDISVDPERDNIDYWFDLRMLFMNENP
ncbi:hypothetical protein EAL2_808p06240 (plasmid) [Peptoclostridium acidaminophilum DSM 3953]|uniref:DUF4153 domain-containing protein n=1 Tax=Peptoclostridium acidaminophilum DSM 3953 TaxID=1286171 RepID=W8TPV9_PEPAC|nr:DUF4153 domain-containing protein [Peptoclostridium acidaminophilum]AHM58127.1 hypothetical protein EAL2_808p06240 [Peptoclostridium acidaminophilum DSM 3953]